MAEGCCVVPFRMLVVGCGLKHTKVCCSLLLRVSKAQTVTPRSCAAAENTPTLAAAACRPPCAAP